MRAVFLVLAITGYLLVGREASAQPAPQTQASLEPGAPPAISSPTALKVSATRQMPVDSKSSPVASKATPQPGDATASFKMPPIPKVAVPQNAEAQWSQCNAKPSDAVLASCSAIIDAGREPHLAQAYKNRAQAWQDKMQFAAALADYDRAIHMSASDVDALQGRCMSRAALGQLVQALADCDQALKIKPDSAAALESRGFVYRKMRAFDRAMADYDAVLVINPKQASALFGRGVVKLDSGNVQGNADISQAKALQPDVANEFHRYGIYR